MTRLHKDRYLGKQFGQLTVLSFVGLDENKNSLWKCKCSLCGNQDATVVGTNLNSGQKSCGCLRLKNLKGGPEKVRKVNGPWRIEKWRKEVFKRDSYTCQGAGPHTARLDAHHLKSANNFPEFKYNVDNGLTLCSACHPVFEKQTKNKEEYEKQKRAFSAGFYSALEMLGLEDKNKYVNKLTTKFEFYKNSLEELKVRKEYKILVDTEGKLTFIYTDSLAKLLNEGQHEVKRVSNVEPDKEGKWVAHMNDGSILGPFRLREEALEAELKYLDEKMFGKLQTEFIEEEN